MPQPTAKRPKLKDICAVAGVSRATVDRVINNRGGVQDHTRQHVLSVIDRLAGTGEANRPPDETVPIDFVIPDQGNAFLANQARAIVDYARQLGTIAATIHRPETTSEDALVALLEGLSTSTRALGIVGVDSHRVREALRGICRRGVPVVTLASDIRNVPRTAYVGIDNHAAGRLAGYLTGRLVCGNSGKAALILGSRAYRGHEEREMGFRSVLREKFPGFRIVNEMEVHEDAGQAHAATMALLTDHPDIDAIYCIGAGQNGVGQALLDAGCGDRVFFVGHGLSADTSNHLVSGVMDVVIDEDPRSEAKFAVDILASALRGKAEPPQAAIAIQPVFCENLPVAP
ncbi:MAG: LacI family DNA-binding transcriptional regulator [Alphaproteobacteria bacterium]|nr:LacI family DNA-binding transcriptional regulator [Alphaproteobacteria bacterium]